MQEGRTAGSAGRACLPGVFQLIVRLPAPAAPLAGALRAIRRSRTPSHRRRRAQLALAAALAQRIAAAGVVHLLAGRRARGRPGERAAPAARQAQLQQAALRRRVLPVLARHLGAERHGVEGGADDYCVHALGHALHALRHGAAHRVLRVI